MTPVAVAGGVVVVSAVGVYLAFLILIRIVGQRALVGISSDDFATTISLGAIIGRAVLGYTPTLGAGVLGMASLFALQSAPGRVRRNRRPDRALSKFPLLLVANGAVLPDNLRKVKFSKGGVRQQLRLAGVHRYDDVAALILERTGAGYHERLAGAGRTPRCWPPATAPHRRAQRWPSGSPPAVECIRINKHDWIDTGFLPTRRRGPRDLPPSLLILRPCSGRAWLLLAATGGVIRNHVRSPGYRPPVLSKSAFDVGR